MMHVINLYTALALAGTIRFKRSLSRSVAISCARSRR